MFQNDCKVQRDLLSSPLRFPVASIVTWLLTMVRKRRQSLCTVNTSLHGYSSSGLDIIFTNQAVSSRKMPSRSSCMKSSPPVKHSTKRYHQSSPALSDPTSKIYTEEESGPKFLAKSTAIVSFPRSFFPYHWDIPGWGRACHQSGKHRWGLLWMGVWWPPEYFSQPLCVLCPWHYRQSWPAGDIQRELWSHKDI